MGPEIDQSAAAEKGPKLRAVFTVERDDPPMTVTCTSPECIAMLLRNGWKLVDPSQSEALMEALAALEPHPTLKEPMGEHRRHFAPQTA